MTTVPRLDLQSPVQFLRGVGPVRARALARLGIETVADLLAHYPRRYFDRSVSTPIGRLRSGQDATVLGEVLTCGERRTRTGARLQTVCLRDDTGVLFCVWFNQRHLLKQFRAGQRVMASGVVRLHEGRRQLAHPDYEVLDAAGAALHTGRLVPVYALTHGVGQHWLRELVHRALDQFADAEPDGLPAEFLDARGLVSRGDSLRGIHFPASAAEQESARRRLVYEELFWVQLLMGLRRNGRRREAGVALARPGDLTRRLVEGLPFRLTAAQRRVLAEILADLRSGRLMHRLLQGDVGSGKTLVALLATLFVVEQGYQALFLAPTEVLARQHGDTIRRLTAPLGVSVEVLTGATRAAERRRILAGAGAGDLQLLVGTHAVLDEQVQLPRLALAVVDEQHRFGVRQRGRTARGGDGEGLAHVLVMSATPIPRSLALTLYGDLDLSVLDEKPSGRRPVHTRLVPAGRESAVYDACCRRLDAGEQGFVVFPVITQTEGQDLKAATAEYERLSTGPFAGRRAGLLHGKLPAREKEAVMNAFAGGELDVLVATTVVEVGIDVPRAGFMVVHHPDRFGLAQLHQLRGRVGRAGQQAVCYLICDGALPEETGERLRYFAAHDDGFALAEEDLRRRGPGDVWGVRQHGLPDLRLANPLRDRDVARACAEDVATLLERDPDLATPVGNTVRRSLERIWGDLLPPVAG
ncbi:MAG: ATP-dependent DNA helicase RecG [Candidatus Krumholzibacteriia bacterium]